MTSVTFAFAYSLSLAGCWRCGRRLVGADPLWTIIAALVLWYGLQVISLPLAAAIGILSPLVVHLVLAGLGLLLLTLRLPTADRPKSPPQTPTPPTWWTILVVAILVWFCIDLVALALHYLHRAPFDGDSLRYHLPIAAAWLQSGDLLATSALYWYYPCSSEMACYGLLSSGGGDVLANWQNLPAMLVFLLAVVRLAEAFGAKRSVSLAVSTLFCLGAHALRRQVFTQENDLFLAAFLLAGLAWLWAPPTRRSRLGWLIPGVALGLAASTKYSGLQYVVLAIGFGALTWRSAAQRHSRGDWLALVLTAIVIGAFPYLRNWFLTGSPFYPLGVTIGPWQVFPDARSGYTIFADIGRTRILPYLGQSETWLLLVRSIRVHVGWLPLLGIPATLLVMRRLPRRGRLAAGGILLGFFVLLVVKPFAAENLPGTLNHLRHGYNPARYSFALQGVLVGMFAAALPLVPLPKRLAAVLGSQVRWLRWSRFGIIRAAGDRVRLLLRQRVTAAVLCCLAALMIVAYLHLPSSRAARQASRIGTYAQIGVELPRTDFFAWYDREIGSREVWAEGLRTYPLLGPDLSNRAVEIPDLLPLIDPSAHLAELPDLLVLSVRCSGPAEPGYGQFTVLDSLVRVSPDWFTVAFADTVIHAYFVHGHRQR